LYLYVVSANGQVAWVAKLQLIFTYDLPTYLPTCK